ncbi:unnamed protein product [Microthlaspi erraticum]|uniref:Uncharacterized protein n=1 Tax=Microthlaspi erraticum TaxID=1685480 RepID=A0A6D2JT18_9BRAS|nr:unnamed protein product [Microthlaspi erraticum]
MSSIFKTRKLWSVIEDGFRIDRQRRMLTSVKKMEQKRREEESSTIRQGDVVDGDPKKTPMEDAYLREKWSTMEDAYLREKWSTKKTDYLREEEAADG